MLSVRVKRAGMIEIFEARARLCFSLFDENYPSFSQMFRLPKRDESRIRILKCSFLDFHSVDSELVALIGWLKDFSAPNSMHIAC